MDASTGDLSDRGILNNTRNSEQKTLIFKIDNKEATGNATDSTTG
jgi:hypothetical protein